MTTEKYWEFVEEYEKELIRRLISNEEYIPDMGVSPKLRSKIERLCIEDPDDSWDAETKIIQQANKNIKAKLRKMFRVR